jgi:hypothetical protein
MGTLAPPGLCYLLGTQLVTPVIASRTGRVRLPAYATEEVPLGPRWVGYVLLGRNYVRPPLRDALVSSARRTRAAWPGTVVRYLDTGFPFPGIPLLPHLSHGDGRKADLALLFSRDGAPVDATLSPIGYWGYVRPAIAEQARAFAERQATCHDSTLRWDLDALQPLWPDLALDVDRTGRLLRELAAEPAVTSLLLEPTLHGVLSSPKLRANPCDVARHDDHVHVSIR